MTSPPPFRLRRLLDPAYLFHRLQKIESTGDLLRRTGNLFVYCYGLFESLYFELRGVPPYVRARAEHYRHEIEGRWLPMLAHGIDALRDMLSALRDMLIALAQVMSLRAERAIHRMRARLLPLKFLKVVLIQAPAWGVECPPYGIAALKSYLTRQGHQVRALDLNLRLFLAASPSLRLEWDPDRHHFWLDPSRVERALDGELSSEVEKAVEGILSERPQVVGFSTLYSNEHASLLLARRIRKRRPGCIIVFGGPQASKSAGGLRLARSGVVDYAVEGEGEQAFSELLERLRVGRDPSDVPGLIYPRDGEILDTGPHALIPDISLLPFPDYSDFPLERYSDPGRLPVSLSRGCPNKCIFCYEARYWGRFRSRKAESLVAEVLHLKRALGDLRLLWFQDSLVNGHMAELTRFAQGLIDSGSVIRWSGQAVVRKEMTPDVLRLLRESGCISLNYGLESASYPLMQRMGKVLARGADIDAVVRDTFEAGIECILNFMFGLPGETEEDFQATLSFVRRNKGFISMVQPSPGFCDFHQGTEGYEHPERFGILSREGTAHWDSEDGENTFLTRMARFERFLETVSALGIKCAYPHRGVYLKNTIIGDYYHSYGMYDKAIPYFERALRVEPPCDAINSRLQDCYRRVRGS